MRSRGVGEKDPRFPDSPVHRFPDSPVLRLPASSSTPSFCVGQAEDLAQDKRFPGRVGILQLLPDPGTTDAGRGLSLGGGLRSRRFRSCRRRRFGRGRFGLLASLAEAVAVASGTLLEGLVGVVGGNGLEILLWSASHFLQIHRNSLWRLFFVSCCIRQMH